MPLPQITLKLTAFKTYIVCGLCLGYLVDATTISECMDSCTSPRHTALHGRWSPSRGRRSDPNGPRGAAVCKSCIYKHLSTNESCPICGVKLSTNPLEQLRYGPPASVHAALRARTLPYADPALPAADACRQDRTLQTIVYKLVPTLKQREEQLKDDFFHRRGLKRPVEEVADTSMAPTRKGAPGAHSFSRAPSPPPAAGSSTGAGAGSSGGSAGRAPGGTGAGSNAATGAAGRGGASSGNTYAADEQIAFFLEPDETRPYAPFGERPLWGAGWGTLTTLPRLSRTVRQRRSAAAGRLGCPPARYVVWATKGRWNGRAC